MFGILDVYSLDVQAFGLDFSGDGMCAVEARARSRLIVAAVVMVAAAAIAAAASGVISAIAFVIALFPPRGLGNGA